MGEKSAHSTSAAAAFAAAPPAVPAFASPACRPNRVSSVDNTHTHPHTARKRKSMFLKYKKLHLLLLQKEPPKGNERRPTARFLTGTLCPRPPGPESQRLPKSHAPGAIYSRGPSRTVPPPLRGAADGGRRGGAGAAPRRPAPGRRPPRCGLPPAARPLPAPALPAPRARALSPLPPLVWLGT